jgi:hypothetical protein
VWLCYKYSLSYIETAIESGNRLSEISNTYETVVNMPTFNTYIQQADDFITKQIHKFEQQKRGNGSPPHAYGYCQMPQYPSRPSQDSSRRLPSQGYPGTPAPHEARLTNRMAPQGWTQEYDPRSQRWNYVERSTGCSQWPLPSHAPPRAATFQPDVLMPSPYEDWTRGRERATSQPPRPGSGGYDSAQGGGSVRGTNSPGQGLHTQLPLGTHLDMKTGKLVSSMFPEGQTHQSWTQEIKRI